MTVGSVMRAWIKHFDDKARENAFVERVSAVLDVTPSHVTIAFLVFLMLLVVTGFGLAPVAIVLQLSFPVYRSYKVLKTQTSPAAPPLPPLPPSSSSTDSLTPERRWLTFFVVFGSIQLFEALVYGFVVATSSLLFLVAKTLFIWWCASDRFQGACRIYEVCIQPFIGNYEQRIDSLVSEQQQQPLLSPEDVASSLRRGEAIVPTRQRTASRRERRVAAAAPAPIPATDLG